MPKQFTAEDGTEMTFEMVEEIQGNHLGPIQVYTIKVNGQDTKEVVLFGTDTERHFKTLEVLLAWGMSHFNDLSTWEGLNDYQRS